MNETELRQALEEIRDTMDTVKPPLGLKPKWVHDGERKCEILEAMERYAKTEKPIPIEWIKELKELVLN